MAIQLTFDLEPKEPRKGEAYSDHSRPKIIQIGPVVRALVNGGKKEKFHYQDPSHNLAHLCMKVGK